MSTEVKEEQNTDDTNIPLDEKIEIKWHDIKYEIPKENNYGNLIYIAY